MLNKNGWGLGQMLLLMGVLAVFLLIAIFYIYNLYNGMSEGINSSYYHDLEDNLKDNALKYLDNYYEDIVTSEKIVITEDTLERYGLAVNLIDTWGRECEGYAVASKSRAILKVDAYISCPSYTTDGYEKERE